MASLIINQAHPLELLALAVVVDGKLVDCDSDPTFVIEDVSTLPATSIRTSTAGTKIGTGRYAAKVSGAAWTPASAYARARITWTFTPPDGEETTVAKYFEVVASTVGEKGEFTYTTVAEVKELHPALASFDSRRIRDMIIQWRDHVDNYCAQRFALRYASSKIRGEGGRKLYLKEPLFGLHELYLNSDTEAYSNTYFRVLTGDSHRWNPIVEFDMGTITAEYGGLFTPELKTGEFAKNYTQIVKGVWGFVDEATQQAPFGVREASRIGVGLTIQAHWKDGGKAVGAPGLVRSEETDMHRIDYSVSGKTSIAGPVMSIMRDPAVRDHLNRFRAPINMGWVG